MPLVHSRRWSVDRSTRFYGDLYCRSYGRRSSVAESSSLRRNAEREHLGLFSDFEHSRSRPDSSSSASSRSYGDSAFLAREERGYGDLVYGRRDRSYDSSHAHDFDRRSGSSWRDRVYPMGGPSDSRDSTEESRDSSSTRDSFYTTRFRPVHTDREIPIFSEKYHDTASIQTGTSESQQHGASSSYNKTSTSYTRRDIPIIKETPEGLVNTLADSQPTKEHSASSFTKTDTLQPDKVISVIKEAPTDTQTDILGPNIDSFASPHTKTGTSKTSLEIPVIREAPKALYDSNKQREFPKSEVDSVDIKTDTSQLKRDSADSGGQEHEAGKCKRVRVLRENSPEGVSVPIIRTDQATKRDRKEGTTNCPDDKYL